MGQPTSLSRSGPGGSTLKLTGLIQVNTNGVRKLGVMRSSPGRHEVLHNGGEDNLGQRNVCHTRLSMSFQIVLKAILKLSRLTTDAEVMSEGRYEHVDGLGDLIGS